MATHFQQVSRRVAPDKINDCILAVWDNGGFVRRESSGEQITICAAADELPRINEAIGIVLHPERAAAVAPAQDAAPAAPDDGEPAPVVSG